MEREKYPGVGKNSLKEKEPPYTLRKFWNHNPPYLKRKKKRP